MYLCYKDNSKINIEQIYLCNINIDYIDIIKKYFFNSYKINNV